MRRGSAHELAAHYREHAARGEVVLVCAAATARRAGAPDAERAAAATAMRELVAAGARPRAAAKALARLSGIAANELYAELTGSGEIASERR